MILDSYCNLSSTIKLRISNWLIFIIFIEFNAFIRCIGFLKFQYRFSNHLVCPIRYQIRPLERLYQYHLYPQKLSSTEALDYVCMKKFFISKSMIISITFFQNICRFRKGHSTQHCSLYMLEFQRKALDKGMYTGILLTDLTKAFDSMSRDLLVAKLNSYGFSTLSLMMINDYLNDRKGRESIIVLVLGVPQGSILGPLLFNIYINDLFLFSSSFKIANYADDCSPYEFSPSRMLSVS